MELNIIEGQIKRPLKVVIYGSEGIGKTTVAAHSIEPLFIDTEGGTAHLNVRRIPRPENWNELLAIIYEIAASPGLCRTLVLDTADWAEQMCVEHICQKYSKAGIEEFGYGKGYTYLSEEFSKLLAALDIVIAVGVNVIVIAHAKMRKQELPDEMGAFDRWEMKLSKQVAPLLKEWCDMLLFCNYQTFVVKTENNNAKAQGGKRVMYTSHHPCWDAKNRFGLPEVMDLSFDGIAHLFAGAADAPAAPAPSPTPVPTPHETVREKLNDAPFTETDLMAFIHNKGHHKEIETLDALPAKFITGWVLKYWNQIKEKMTATDGQNA